MPSPHGYVPALIKIDVEGADLQVLQGAQRTLAAHRPSSPEHGLGSADHYDTCPEDFDALLTGPATASSTSRATAPTTAPPSPPPSTRPRCANFLATPKLV